MFANAEGKQQRRFDSYSVRNSVLIVSHITFRDCRVHIFSDNLSRNSCIHNLIIILSRIYNEPIQRPAHSWLVSLTGRALHRHRRRQGFESHTSLIFFFRLSFRNCKSCESPAVHIYDFHIFITSEGSFTYNFHLQRGVDVCRT